MRDAEGFIIKCKHSEWRIINEVWDHDDVCTFYPNYSNLFCYADERCAHYEPDIKTKKEDTSL